MQLSSIPAKIAAIFAGSAAPTSVNTIPLTQAGITQPGQASFDVGFPTITMTPAASGGVNPYGQDINGLGKVLTAVQQWQSAGGLFPFDAAFSAAVGGYPKGAILLRADGTGFWLNRADNNTVNPDTVGTNWVTLAPGWTDGVDTGAANACVVAYTPSVLYLKDGMLLWFKAAAANTAATTLNVNGLGASPVLNTSLTALTGGEILANSRYGVIWSATLSSWVLLTPTPASQTEVNAGTDDAKFVTPKKLRFGFAVLLAANGYIALPSWLGGWIFQWGSGTVTAGTLLNVLLPTAFPNAAYVSMATVGSSNVTAPAFATSYLPDTSHVSLAISTGTFGVNFYAVGR